MDPNNFKENIEIIYKYTQKKFKDKNDTLYLKIIDYINSLNTQENIALHIAANDLESSFSIEKSIGFKTWEK
tara:strand:- start:260 stop:475 length:216 start_codon:yes stop_codon:yes gene_type:complete